MKDNKMENILEAAVIAAIQGACSIVIKEWICDQYNAYDERHKPLPPKKWWETNSHYEKRVGK